VVEALQLPPGFIVHTDNDYFPDFFGAVISCEFDVSHLLSLSKQRKQALLPYKLADAVIKRQGDYLAGRYAGGCALDQIGKPVEHIAMHADRSPVWPDGCRGSITHSGFQALSVVGLTAQYNYLGIDIEKIFTGKLAKDLSPQIINSIEKSQLKTLNKSEEWLLTLVFSAKERSLVLLLTPLMSRVLIWGRIVHLNQRWLA